MNAHILVIMEGGIIQDMVIPAGCVVEVHDYDVEGAEPEIHDIDTDDDGAEFVRSVWEGGAA